ncbi:MAG: NADP-dependent glyceraldehyde-3-phosphate dehydrogenase [Candidatus Riflebacteria bacterium]|nr:NADP-dependent glyceraldehyde-3-phosphate dehydrogenase [Candidatus Riflebacteria bacterium]
MTDTANLKALFPKKDDIPAEFSMPLMEQDEYLINGELRKWNGERKDVFSPVRIKDGDNLIQPRLGSVPNMTEKEALEALDAAVAAYDHGRGQWPTMAVADRIKHVQKFVEQMISHRDEIVNLLMWEICKNLDDALKEFDRTVDYIKDTIEALKDLDRTSSRFKIEQGIIAQIRRAPLGVVLSMGPFNYPLNETFTTLIPALIMGNTVVFKTPKLGCLLFWPLLKAFRDSFPPGVINTVYGSGRTIITPIVSSGKIDVLAFIGSSKASDSIRKNHPKPHRMRCVLGLDAKNPAIILPDADIERAAKECALGALSFNGQRCTALKMLWVHSSIVDDFIPKFIAEVEKMQMGMPWTDGVRITPVAEASKPAHLAELIDDAVSHGAKVINPSGGVSCESLVCPTVVYPVNDKMRIYTEEQFGPVVPVAVYDEIEEAINYVVMSDYGQQVSLFGKDPKEMASLIDPMVNQVCRVNLNSQCQRGPDVFPFTGRKDSAEGTLSVSDALRVFTIRTLVAAKDTEDNKQMITTILKDDLSSFLTTDFIF